MMNLKIPRAAGDADSREFPFLWWNVAAWLLAAGAFVTAAVLSYREIHYNIPNDLRSPVVLAVDALLATAVAFGFAMHEGSLTALDGCAPLPAVRALGGGGVPSGAAHYERRCFVSEGLWNI
jgi:hypothetical protein